MKIVSKATHKNNITGHIVPNEIFGDVKIVGIDANYIYAENSAHHYDIETGKPYLEKYPRNIYIAKK